MVGGCRSAHQPRNNRYLTKKGLNEVKKGECGPQLKKFLHDVITEHDVTWLPKRGGYERIDCYPNDHNDAPGPSPTTLPRAVN
jgi:hypothetical protein